MTVWERGEEKGKGERNSEPKVALALNSIGPPRPALVSNLGNFGNLRNFGKCQGNFDSHNSGSMRVQTESAAVILVLHWYLGIQHIDVTVGSGY